MMVQKRQQRQITSLYSTYCFHGETLRQLDLADAGWIDLGGLPFFGNSDCFFFVFLLSPLLLLLLLMLLLSLVLLLLLLLLLLLSLHFPCWFVCFFCIDSKKLGISESEAFPPNLAAQEASLLSFRCLHVVQPSVVQHVQPIHLGCDFFPKESDAFEILIPSRSEILPRKAAPFVTLKPQGRFSCRPQTTPKKSSPGVQKGSDAMVLAKLQSCNQGILPIHLFHLSLTNNAALISPVSKALRSTFTSASAASRAQLAAASWLHKDSTYQQKGWAWECRKMPKTHRYTNNVCPTY